MDLVVLVLVLALIGFLVHLIVTKIPMDPTFRLVIQILVVVLVVLYLLRRFGGLPNVL